MSEESLSVKEAVAQAQAQQKPETQPIVSQETAAPVEATPAPVAEAKAEQPAEQKPGSYAREWAKVRRLEKQAKELEAQAKAEREAAAKEKSEAAKVLEALKQDPAAFLLQHGGTEAYTAATRKMLDQHETPEERLARIEKENRELREMVPKIGEDLRNEIKNEKATATWAAYEREVEAEAAKEEFALLRDLDLVDETKNLAVEWYSQHGEALTARQSAEKMAEYVRTTLVPQFAKSESLKQQLLKEWGLTQAPSAKPSKPIKTITNTLTNNVPGSDVLPDDKVLSPQEETRRVLRAMGVAVRE